MKGRPHLLSDSLVPLLLDILDQLLIALRQFSVEGPQSLKIDLHCLNTTMCLA